MSVGQSRAGVLQPQGEASGRGRQRYDLMAIIEYDGTEYLGFQIQRVGRTVQGELERALGAVTQHKIRVIGSGRTDTGVHAKGQVIHFTALWGHPLADLHRAVNAVLAADVSMVELREAPPGFHARFSARSREYLYTVYDGTVRSPLARRVAGHCPGPLDEGAMDRACQSLVGRHDFLPFGWPPRGDNTVRTIYRAGCRRQGELVFIELEADAFLRRMVRRIVGNLLLVGAGRLTEAQFAGLLALKTRRTPAVDAPAQGLCLVRVNY